MAQAAKEKENYFSAYKFFAKTRAGKDPAWLKTLRQRASESFEELDFPTTRDEERKYTNVALIFKTQFRQVFDLGAHCLTTEIIEPFTFAESRHSRLVFINGLFSRELSDLTDLPGGKVVSNLADVPAEHAKVVGD